MNIFNVLCYSGMFVLHMVVATPFIYFSVCIIL